MTGILDAELFPDECEVVEIPLHSQWVYLIQKNGSSSLRDPINNYRFLSRDEIKDLNVVDVYIRNPRARYLSGVNTYLQHLQRDYPELDQDTAFWFAKHYKFLNRHYLPQFFWLQNLSRFISKDTKIRFRNFNAIGLVTQINSRAGVKQFDSAFAEKLLQDDNNIEYWFYLDQILLQLAGQSLTWSELTTFLRNNHSLIAQRVLPQT